MRETEEATTEARLDDALIQFGHWRRSIWRAWLAPGVLVCCAFLIFGLFRGVAAESAGGLIDGLVVVGPSLISMFTVVPRVARFVVRLRSPAAIERFSSHYEVDAGELAKLSKLLTSLDGNSRDLVRKS